MTDFSVGDPRGSAPVSDGDRQEALALARLATAVRELQQVAAGRALPRGFEFSIDSAGDVWLVDRAQRRRSKLTTAWEAI